MTATLPGTKKNGSQWMGRFAFRSDGQFQSQIPKQVGNSLHVTMVLSGSVAHGAPSPDNGLLHVHFILLGLQHQLLDHQRST